MSFKVILSALILILSLSLLFFYFQALCQRILRREFERAYFLAVVRAGALEFASVRLALETPEAPFDFAQCRVALQCDLLTLRYLLKHAANLHQKFTWQERMLLVYYRWSSAAMAVRHRLGMNEKASILKMTAVLQYFANVVGERNFRMQPDTAGYWK
jgi:hypothetical protein